MAVMEQTWVIYSHEQTAKRLTEQKNLDRYQKKKDYYNEVSKKTDIITKEKKVQT